MLDCGRGAVMHAANKTDRAALAAMGELHKTPLPLIPNTYPNGPAAIGLFGQKNEIMAAIWSPG